ncbi:MAG: hypothetical protein U0797_10115 [Gemmataceae bacterium]
MLILLLLLLGAWAVLAVLLTAWTMYVQAYLYTEATPGAVWRGPAAAGVVMAVLLPWVLLDFRSPGSFRPLWEFSSSQDDKPFPELRVPNASGGEDVYKLRPGTRGEYRLDGVSGGKQLPTRPAEVVVVEGSDRSVFKPERDEKGNYKQRTTSAFGRETRSRCAYLDEKGRVMTEDARASSRRSAAGCSWSTCCSTSCSSPPCSGRLWLLLCFQWPHAAGPGGGAVAAAAAVRAAAAADPRRGRVAPAGMPGGMTPTIVVSRGIIVFHFSVAAP